jgi:hypothetical protein
MIKALMLHPYDNVMGNLRWASKKVVQDVRLSESLPIAGIVK